MKVLPGVLRRFFHMTDEDYASAAALRDSLVTDFILRVFIECTLAVLYAWTGEPFLAAVWIILVIPAESAETVLHYFASHARRITPIYLYGQFFVSLLGGGVWAGTGAALWMTGNVFHMVGGLAMIVGLVMHVTYKYSDWIKGAIVGAIPPMLALISLPWLPIGREVPISFRSLMVFGLLGLMYYMYIVAAASITKQRQLKKALNAASAANEFKSIFLANMSHEIRTPMNGVLGMADLLGRTKLSTQQQEMVDVIQTSGVTLIGVIDDILDLSKIEAGHLTLETEEFSLNELVGTICCASEMAAREKNLIFTCSYQPDPNDYFICDALRLRQVIGNLLSNAIKFTSEGEVALDVSVQPLEGSDVCRLVVKVRDTGPGLSEADLEQVFRPFVQADGSMTRRHGGTGLGLAIVTHIAGIMQGDVSVQSKVGQGSEFIFQCPLRRAVGQIDNNASDEPVTEIVAVHGRRPAILVADDHRLNRRLLELMLNEMDVDVTFVEDGIKAVDICRTQIFDLILMDIQMPGLNGVEAFRHIRENERKAGRRPAPMIAMTANAMKHQVDEYMSAGFDRHLPKPILIEDLLGSINAALSGHSDNRRG